MTWCAGSPNIIKFKLKFRATERLGDGEYIGQGLVREASQLAVLKGCGGGGLVISWHLAGGLYLDVGRAVGLYLDVGGLYLDAGGLYLDVGRLHIDPLIEEILTDDHAVGIPPHHGVLGASRSNTLLQMVRILSVVGQSALYS